MADKDGLAKRAGDALTASDFSLVSLQRGPVSGFSLSDIETSVADSRPVFDPLSDKVDEVLWAELASNHYREGINFPELLRDSQVLLLGDTNHGNVAIQRGIIDSLPALKDAGVTHFAVEIPDNFSAGDIDDAAKLSRLPHCYSEMVKKAEELGMEVRFIDLSLNSREGFCDQSSESIIRGRYMGEKLAEILASGADARVAALVGFGHIRDFSQIPMILSQKGISYLSTACVTKGQHSVLPGIGDSMLELPLTAGISSATGGKANSGYLDLSAAPGISTADGIILFPRPRPAAYQARELLRFEQIKGYEGAALSVISAVPGRIAGRVYMNYADPDMVDSDSRDWRSGNQSKITDCIASLVKEGSLTSGEGLYLATLLCAFANSAGRHSLSGSIVELGFVPEGQYFEISTVDTMGYPFNPALDYGARMYHYQISIDTLHERFGYLNTGRSGAGERLGELTVANNPESPGSLLRFAPYALIGLYEPGRLVVYSYMGTDYQLRVCSSPGNGLQPSVITSLTIDDFELSKEEQTMIRMRENLASLEKFARSIQYDKTVKEAANRADNRILERYFSPSSCFKPEREILFARCEMRQMNAEELSKLMPSLCEARDELALLIGTCEGIADRRPDIKDAPPGDDYQSGASVKTIGEKLHLARALFNQFSSNLDDLSNLYPSLAP